MKNHPTPFAATSAAVCILALALNSCAMHPSRPQAGKNKFEPPDGKVILIVGQNAGVFETYTASTGTTPAGFMVYTSVQEMTGLDEASHYEGVTQYAQPMVDRYPNTAVQIGLYMVDALDQVTGGEYDGNIDKLGNWIQKIKRPVFLRIGYEFDGDHNHHDPAKYAAAYRHIVDRLRGNNVDNAAYVWHSVGSPVSRPPEAWYPGDDYVDWFAISYFDQPESMMMPMVELAKTHRKPLMIAESTPRAGGSTCFGKGSWDHWFKPYFQFIEANHVKAVSYIDDNWETIQMWKGKGWGDARVEANKYVKERWMEEIRTPKYLHASPELFKKLGYSPR